MSQDAKNQADEPAPVILVVDDEANVLSALTRSLRRQPWRLLTAESGAAGLSLLGSNPVDVVISDYQMPEMNGIEFLNQVKRGWPGIQRIMLTGNADLSMIEHLVNRSEVSRFLTKPWSDSQLKITIAECVERVQLARAKERYKLELAARNRDLERLNRHLEQMVEERTRSLVQAEKLAWLGRMAGGVAHEINNPLGGILAFGQILKRGKGTEADRQEALDAIITCALRCKTIIDDLLSFARRPHLTNGDEIDVNSMLEKAWSIAKLNPLMHERDLQLLLGDDLPAVTGQASLLQQVVINLLQNAFQATSSDQAVRLCSSDKDDWVEVRVEDEGSGVPAEVLPNIFEPFYTTKEVGQGTGLGLAICYGIVQEHHGELLVDSEEGHGTRFTIRLRARKSSGEMK